MPFFLVNELEKFWDCSRLYPKQFLPKYYRFREIKVSRNIDKENEGEKVKASYNEFLSNCFACLIVDALHYRKNLGNCVLIFYF